MIYIYILSLRCDFYKMTPNICIDETFRLLEQTFVNIHCIGEYVHPDIDSGLNIPDHGLPTQLMRFRLHFQATQQDFYLVKADAQ